VATRAQIARAKAQVALAQRSDEILPDRVYDLAKLELSDAEREENN